MFHAQAVPHRKGVFFCTLFCLQLLAIALCITLPHILSAQTIPISPKTIKDSKGKDFWLAFPRNHHENGGGSLDKIYISIVSERATQGKIEYIHEGKTRTQAFALVANDVYTFEQPYFGLELEGQTISRTTFHITSDEEVTVYGLSLATTTSDAFLAFPTDVLGREHIIASYPTNIRSNQNNFLDIRQSTVSQFAIVAPYDSTVVSITPTVKTWNNDTTTYSIVLNRGEGYLVSLYPSIQNVRWDFTGSRVISSKPVVVYGGHERAAIPVSQQVSRDYLIEQMLPIEVWGKTALVAPFPTPTRGDVPETRGCDLVRVIAGYNNTVVTVNNVTVATLQTGGFYEMAITTSASIVTSEPSIVASYKCSATANIGDPFLAIIPPVEQFLTRYRFVCVQGTQVANNTTGRTEPAFREHYVSIVVPSTKATSVLLNGQRLSLQNFRRIHETNYSYASIPLFEGIHNISADTTFGITVTGYGRANSYGYIGGQRFETDIRPPQFAVRRSCTGIDGTIFDSSYTDSKIFYYDTLRAAQRNVRFRFGNLPRPADSLTFQADLLNPYEDGIVGLIAVDSLDLRSVQPVVVPGFTVHQDSTIRNDAVVSTTSILRLATGRDYCFRLNVKNYGSTNQTVQRVGFTQNLPQFSSTSFRPIRIEPRSQGTLEYCFRTDQDGIFTDTLTINNGCLTRKIIAIRIEARQDRLAPTLAITRNADTCGRTITLETTDNRTFDAGLASVSLNLINMTARQEFIGIVNQVPDSTKRPLRITLTVNDPRADGVYAVRLTDSVGNQRLVSDTIPGFTARFLASQDTSSGILRGIIENTLVRNEYKFQSVNATSLTCGTIAVQNTGIVPFILDQPFISRNIQLSLPISQFPLIIPAGQTRLLTVCFNPSLVAQYRDTLTVSKYCVTEQIALIGEGLAGEQIVGTRCKADVRVSPQFGTRVNPTANIPNTSTERLQIRHFPDPANTQITLHIEVPETEILSVKLHSMVGVEIASLPKQVFTQGAWELDLHLTSVESGTYYCEVFSAISARRWTGLVRVVR
jgi:hypothetical protein